MKNEREILAPEIAQKALEIRSKIPAGVLEIEERNRHAFDGFTAFVAAHNYTSDELSKAAKNKEAVPVTSSSGDEIPGKMPRTAIGKLAIKAARQIELETDKRATAKQVIEKLQAWIETEPELIETIPHGVKWTTTKGKQKPFDVEACAKALEIWQASRA